MVTRDRDAGRVDLRKTGVTKKGAPFMGFPNGRDIAAHGVGREIEYIAVAAAGNQDGMAEMPFKLAADQVAGDDPAGLSVDKDNLEHFMPGEHFDITQRDLPFQGLVSADQQLLARLSGGIKSPLNLNPAEGPVAQQAAVFAGERHSLSDALVDDIGADLGQPMNIGFPGPIVPALDGIIEQAEGAVAVILVILGGINASLRRDAVRPSGGILEAKCFYFIPHFAQGGCGRGASQSRADNDHFQAALVGWVYQLYMAFIVFPFLF